MESPFSVEWKIYTKVQVNDDFIPYVSLIININTVKQLSTQD